MEVEDMNTDQKLDMVISMVANLAEQMTEKFDQVDEKFVQIDKRFEQIDKRFEQIDERFEQVDKRFEQIDEKFEQIDEKFDRIDERFAQMNERFNQVDEKIEVFRAENRQEHDVLRGQIGGVVEALKVSNAVHDAHFVEMKQKQEEYEQILKLHSVDIMALRAAM